MPFKGENSSFTKDFSKLFVLGKIIFKLLQNNSMTKVQVLLCYMDYTL